MTLQWMLAHLVLMIISGSRLFLCYELHECMSMYGRVLRDLIESPGVLFYGTIDKAA